MLQIQFEVFNDMFDQLETFILHCFLKCFLNVPEHQVAQELVVFAGFSKQFLKPVKVVIGRVLCKRVARNHKLHELFFVICFELFDTVH